MSFKTAFQISAYFALLAYSATSVCQNLKPSSVLIADNGVKAENRSHEIVDLPDAPSATVNTLSNPNDPESHQSGSVAGALAAPKYADTIEPEYGPRHLGSRDKVIFGLRELFSVRYVAGDFIQAGFSHIANTDPKYGTNKEAFAQRLGASAAGSASQILFSDSLLAPVLRQDPRYYVLGTKHRVLTRFLYAASSVVIARNDNGSHVVNFANLGGYAGSVALTQLYYPKGNRGIDVMLTGYGSSLGGLALQNEAVEFFRFLVRGQPR